ncbi:MAG TPA: ATP-binding protein [Pyrinomonadaceae bacterium]|nr:ATP-binding protein [Pyrinomonadaceae bacterium]
MHKDEKHKNRASKLGIIFKEYFVAVWSVGIIFALTVLLSPFVSPDISPLFLIAIMVSAWRGGLGAGLLATALTVLIDIFIFLPPKAPLAVDKGDFLQLVVDAFAAVVVGTLVASKRKAENERKELLLREQAARIEAENANNVKDEFLAAVSHELRTPLTTIKTLTRILLRKKSLEDEQRDFLEDIDSECDRQIDLVHNLLDLSRIKAGKMHIKFEAVDVKEILRACEKIQRVEAVERNHQIQIEAAPDLPFVYADSNALRRVICSIMENAVKYTPDNGNILLKAYRDGSETVNIEISDNGRGIHEADLPHIFESFYRGRAAENIETDTQEDSGVGLGLYIAHSLVEAMNGKISVESRIGRGSKITIQLPVREQMKHSPSDKIRQTESGRGKRIKSI